MREDWSYVGFGSYCDKTLPEVVLSDPGWFFHELKGTSLWESAYCEVNELAYKACNIKVPTADPENWKIIWSDDLLDGRDAFRIMGREEPIIDYAFTMSHLDLSWPRRWHSYDAGESAAVAAAFRKNYLGGAELTPERCNAFFSNNENFVSPY